MNRVEMRELFRLLTAAALICGLVSCGEESPGRKPAADARPSQTSTQIFFVKGLVKELKPGGKTVVIKHEEIPNYMPAMTMPFEVKSTRELAGLRPEDEVSFRMLVTDKEGWIDQLYK